ncbi:helix-turn-helix domain-containing protein [Streptomyces europaeiscabiei]
MEHRFRAVAEVLDGAPVAEVARRYGTSRQSLHTWLRRFREGGRDGLRDRSRRPHTSPSRVSADAELAICRLRQAYPKWGARRIAHELAVRGMPDAPGRSTVHRGLVRNGLVTHQVQVHRRVYKRWQRDAPMRLCSGRGRGRSRRRGRRTRPRTGAGRLPWGSSSGIGEMMSQCSTILPADGPDGWGVPRGRTGVQARHRDRPSPCGFRCFLHPARPRRTPQSRRWSSRR